MRFGWAVCVCSSAAWAAPPQTVGDLELEVAKKTINLVVTRQKQPDGGSVIKLAARGLGKPQTLTLYQGGGDDDGPNDVDIKKVLIDEVELGKLKVARVDINFRIPGTVKKEIQTDTMLIGFDGKMHKLVELRTYYSRTKSKLCRDGEEVTLAGSAETLTATKTAIAEPALDDEDQPIDKSCKPKGGPQKVIYKMKGDHFVQVDPAPAETEEQ